MAFPTATGPSVVPSSTGKQQQQKLTGPSQKTTSAFRLVEKRYKSRLPPAGTVLTHTEARRQRRQGASWRPALTDVWDLRALLPAGEPRVSERGNGEWGEAQLPGVECVEIGRAGVKAWAVKAIPGLVVLPAYLSPAEQRQMVGSCLADYTQPPNRTNLDQHFVLPEAPATLWSLYSAAAAARSAPPGATAPAAEEDVILPRHAFLTAAEAAEYDRMPSGRTLVQNTEGERLTSEEVARTGSHRPEPSSSARPTPVTQLLKELRWTNIGLFYDWSSKNYDFRRRIPFPEALGIRLSRIVKTEIDWASVYTDLPDQAGGSVKWQGWAEDYENDAGIINAYQAHDSLMAHVDRSELDPHRPLVSVSLGLSAIFLLGGTTRDETPLPLLLRSGDVIVLSGPSRRSYHGIPRVLDGTLPGHFSEALTAEESSSWDPVMADYLQTTRININARQVFPPGFDPATLFAAPEASPFDKREQDERS